MKEGGKGHININELMIIKYKPRDHDRVVYVWKVVSVGPLLLRI